MKSVCLRCSVTVHVILSVFVMSVAGRFNIKEFPIDENNAGQRLDRFISKAVPLLPASLAQKYIRTKRIKVGGRKASRDYRLTAGDVVQMYINGEFFSPPEDNKTLLKRADKPLDIVYQDDNIMLINKPAGLLCYSTDDIYADTIITRVQAYLYKNGDWHPGDSCPFAPALCNRIDRNTSGIVIAAKNAQSLRIICEKIKQGEIDKNYLAVVHGVPELPEAVLEGYIFKDAVKNRVYVRKVRTVGAKSAVMEYKTLRSKDNLSLLECKLITGRTHQIRAQLASIGHPIVGDSKYGRGDLDRPLKETKQALCSYKITFSFKTDAGIMSYLNNQTFILREVPFLSRYFPKTD